MPNPFFLKCNRKEKADDCDTFLVNPKNIKLAIEEAAETYTFIYSNCSLATAECWLYYPLKLCTSNQYPYVA